MNREDIWTISKTISSREPRLPGPKVGDTEFFKNAWKSFLIRFRSFERHFIFFTLKNILGLVKFFCRQFETIWNYMEPLLYSRFQTR